MLHELKYINRLTLYGTIVANDGNNDYDNNIVSNDTNDDGTSTRTKQNTTLNDDFQFLPISFNSFNSFACLLAREFVSYKR